MAGGARVYSNTDTSIQGSNTVCSIHLSGFIDIDNWQSAVTLLILEHQ